jgi:hypothetical protein
MNRILFKIRRLATDRRGATAMVFATLTPLLLGAGAFAVDMAHYRYVDSRLQSAADSAALAGIRSLDDEGIATSEAVEFAQRNVPESYGTVTQASDVDIGIYDPATDSFTVASGEDVNAIRVRAVRSAERDNAPPRILSAFLGIEPINITATAIAARQRQSVQYEPPERTNLDNEAHDYNEIWAYCFKYNGDGTPASNRSQMTLISNNMPANRKVTVESKGKITQEPPGDDLVWPECAPDESLSFRLRNFRTAKYDPTQWTKNKDIMKEGKGMWNHYTDTKIVNGVEDFALTNNILETVRCDTLAQCVPGQQVPKGKNRTPKVETEPCLPGKYMYFGWEDRPPSGSSDKDYDDIVIVMKCPKRGILGDGLTRLVG